jgi:hypothetical protein
MENPAKRTRLAPRELELLDLDDDALIMIIDKLDHKSKLQMMTTCKRFEGLIGQTHQFYKNFKFCYNQQHFLNTNDTQYLQTIRRRFGTVEVSNGKKINRYRNKLLSPSILEFLKKIGADILKIKFDELFFYYKSDFLELMKALPKIEELEMKAVELLYERDSDKKIEDFKLIHLTNLDIYRSTNLCFCTTFVPASLKSLKINYIFDEENWAAEVLGKQKHLEELSLNYCKIEDFKFDPENCHIEKLSIEKVKFLNGSAFENFSDFMKTQDSVSELEFGFFEDQLKNLNHKGLLMHLLSLKSLKKFSFGCGNKKEIFSVFSTLKVCSPGVDTLTIHNPLHEGADLNLLPKLFPNVTSLKITCKYHEDLFDSDLSDLSPINSMKMVRKLEIDHMTDVMLAQLELKEMREFHLKKIASVIDYEVLANWRTFINNNSQLDVLHMPECSMSVEQLKITLENLPSLKSLEFTVYGCDTELILTLLSSIVTGYEKKQAEETARLIGENYERLEHLKLKFEDEDISACILKYLAMHYPGVKLEK